MFIKDTNNEENLVVNGLLLDVTLPPLYAFDYMINSNDIYIIGAIKKDIGVERWSGTTYNIKNAYYKFEKITDENLVNAYKNAKLNNTSISTVFSIDKSAVEKIDNWTYCSRDYSYPCTKIEKSKMPTEQGVYYLWVKAKDTDSKTVYGCIIIDIDGDGPKVKSIRVSSPTEGTYKVPQTVTLHVEFDETIEGTTVPTLKIKFGDSPVREINAGTIKNPYSWSHYIEYTYNIQDTDVGQLATVSLSGGNIKDTSGNEANLTCPVITGNAIKANTEGSITNNTENQDKTNNNGNPTTPGQNNGSNGNNGGSSVNNNGKGADKTTANVKKIPQIGEGIALIIILTVLAGIGIVFFIRYKKYREIK